MLMKAVVTAVAAVVVSDLAQKFAPDSLDFQSLPVRKFAGAVAGVWAAHKFFPSKAA